TSVGGNPELVNDDRGLLVPARDIEALADATAQLLNNANRRAELGANARRFARNNFSAESITKKYEDLYNELLSRKSRRISVSMLHGIRVAIVGPSLHYVGGQSVQADLLLRRWEGDPDVHVSFIAVDPRFPAGLRWVARVPGLRTIVRTPFYLAGLWRGLRDVDVAHIFSASYSSFVVAVFPAWLIATMRGKKTLINYHSGEARDHLGGSWFARAVLKRASGVVTPSGYLIDVFRQFGLQAAPVSNIVDLSQFAYRL